MRMVYSPESLSSPSRWARLALHVRGWSQASRTIKIVISAPPGTIDLLVRVCLADYLGRTRGQTIVIESGRAHRSSQTVARASRTAPRC
jgi:hypothetical protein